MTEIDPNTNAPPHSSYAATSPGWLIRLALPLVLVLAGLLAFAFLNDYQNWGDDWAQYMLQAKAILDRDVQECIRQNAFMTRESAAEPASGSQKLRAAPTSAKGRWRRPLP